LTSRRPEHPPLEGDVARGAVVEGPEVLAEEVVGFGDAPKVYFYFGTICVQRGDLILMFYSHVENDQAILTDIVSRDASAKISDDIWRARPLI